jgi:hypothetical protein
MTQQEKIEKIQKRMDWENEQADKGVEPYASNRKRMRKKIKEVKRHFKFNMIVPPKVFDFLRKMKVQLSREEIEKNLKDGVQLYSVYTRKTRGNNFYNPKLIIDREMFEAIQVIRRNQKSSIILKNDGIHFNKSSRELRIWGYSTYIKKGSSRFEICSEMFGKKRCPMRWSLKRMCEIIGEPAYSNREVEERKGKVRGKIRYLNEDIESSIGIKDFIVEENGLFIVNPINKPQAG